MKNMSKETKKALKDEIKSMLDSVSMDTDLSKDVIDEEFKDLNKIDDSEFENEFESKQLEFSNESKKIINSLLKHYVELGIITESEYVNNKANVDSLSMSNILFQVDSLKNAIKLIMKELYNGNINPRLLDSLGNLQDKLKSIIQMQSNYLLFLEESYKKLNNDEPVNKLNDSEIIVDIDTGEIIKDSETINKLKEAENKPAPNKKEKGDLELYKETEMKSSVKIEDDYVLAVGSKSIIDNIETDEEIYKDDNDNDLVDPKAKNDLRKELNIKDEENDTKISDDDVPELDDII